MFKKKNNNSIVEIVNKIDVCVDKIYNSTSKNSYFVFDKLKFKINHSSLTKNQIETIEDIEDSFINKRVISENDINELSNDISNVINGTYVKKEDPIGNIVDELLASIKELEHKSLHLQSLIDAALSNRNKSEWKVYSEEKRIVDYKLKILNDNLDTALLKKSSNAIASSLKESNETNGEIENSNIININKIENYVSDSQLIVDGIKSENNQINVLLNNQNDDFEFDKACEEYLLKNNQFVESEIVNSDEV